jgi:chromosomal replication initiation ATPase DnaA
MKKTDKKITKRIIAAVVATFNVSAFDICRKSRRADLVDARDATIWMMKGRLKISNDDISKVFGMNVSTVTYSLKRSRERITINTFDNREWLAKLVAAKKTFKLI